MRKIAICPGGDKLLFINLDNYDIITERGELIFIGDNFTIIVITKKELNRGKFIANLGIKEFSISTDNPDIESVIVRWHYKEPGNEW